VSPIVVTPVLRLLSEPDPRVLCEAVTTRDWSRVPAMVTVAAWTFRGVSRFDSIISGGLAKGEVTVEPAWNRPDLLACIGINESYNGPHPIAGGSDAPRGGTWRS